MNGRPTSTYGTILTALWMVLELFGPIRPRTSLLQVAAAQAIPPSAFAIQDHGWALGFAKICSLKIGRTIRGLVASHGQKNSCTRPRAKRTEWAYIICPAIHALVRTDESQCRRRLRCADVDAGWHLTQTVGSRASGPRLRTVLKFLAQIHGMRQLVLSSMIFGEAPSFDRHFERSLNQI